MTTANLSTLSAEVIYQPIPLYDNVSTLSVDAMYVGMPSLNVTATRAEAMHTGMPTLNVTASRMEVMYQVTYDNVASERIQLSYKPNTINANIASEKTQLSYSSVPDINIASEATQLSYIGVPNVNFASINYQFMYQVTAEAFGAVSSEVLYSSGDNTNTNIKSVTSESLYVSETNTKVSTVITEVLMCIKIPHPRRKPIYLVTSR